VNAGLGFIRRERLCTAVPLDDRASCASVAGASAARASEFWAQVVELRAELDERLACDHAAENFQAPAQGILDACVQLSSSECVSSQSHDVSRDTGEDLALGRIGLRSELIVCRPAGDQTIGFRPAA